jgi:hypothetical protein
VKTQQSESCYENRTTYAVETGILSVIAIYHQLTPLLPVKFRIADLHVSLLSREKKDSPEARFGGARTANSGRPRSSHACLSAMVPAFAEPDIHSLSRILADRHRRLSVCSLPVLKQSGESLGSLISVAQSATAGPGSLRAV